VSEAHGQVINERALLLILGAVQFVNVLDFMMVMPLGPDFAVALGIETSHLGIVAGSYTAAAAVSGLLCMLFLDRFDRKKALIVTLVGLSIGTIAGGFAVGLGSLLAARVFAGMFGGPTSSLSMAIIADVIPVERRGRAMGAVMGAFAIASVFGVPAGLEAARLGWRAPFFGVASLGLIVVIAAWRLLPSLRGHLGAGPPMSGGAFVTFLKRPASLLSLTAFGITTMSVFTVVPSLTAYLQFNLGYPREHLGILYLAGGIVSFFAMRIAGRLADRFGSTPIAAFGAAVFVTVLSVGFIPERPYVPIIVLFIGFMLAGSFRMIALSSLTTRVPGPTERARFMSVQSAVQHVTSATGAGLSSVILTALPGGRLGNMPTVAGLSIFLGAILPFFVWALENRVRADEKQLRRAAIVSTVEVPETRSTTIA
jgi:predicted MFS family arabinose efflux permease